jgi:PAS domain S-box-containing protein
MVAITPKSDTQKSSEATVDEFRRDLGPFVVAAEKTRMPMIFTGTEPSHPVIFVNDAFLKLTGYRRDEVLAKSFQSLLANGVSAEDLANVNNAFAEPGKGEPEIHYKRKDGSEFWASMFVSPVCDEQGTVVQQFVSLVDLTAHREDNNRCKKLIDELNHRVKNTLATVQSIVVQALRRPAEPQAIREAIESRLLALSRSHDLLTSTNWAGSGLHDLVDVALHPFEVIAERGERFTVTGENIHLPPNITLSLAIGLHELATNALKYGAFSNELGTIAIDWSVVRNGTGDRLVLHWRESGGPPVSKPTGKGFGSWVLERGLAHELNGQVTTDYSPEGLVCTIDMPAFFERGA